MNAKQHPRQIPQGRIVHLILFGGPGQRTELRLQRGLGGLEGLTEFLGLSFHSGTDYDGPLIRATELLHDQALERADILVVTDGLAEAHPEIVARLQEARERRGARVWSVVLDSHRTGGVEPFSDEVWQMDPWEAARAAGVVGRFGDTTL